MGNGLCLSATTDGGVIIQVRCNNRDPNQYFKILVKSESLYVIKNLLGDYIKLNENSGQKITLNKNEEKAFKFTIIQSYWFGRFFFKVENSCVDSNDKDSEKSLNSVVGLKQNCIPVDSRDYEASRTQTWTFVDPDTLEKFIIRSRSSGKCLIGRETSSDVFQDTCDVSNVSMQYTIKSLNKIFQIKSIDKFYFGFDDGFKSMENPNKDWEITKKTHWSFDNKNPFLRIMNINKSNCLNAPDGNQDTVTAPICNDDESQKLDLLAVGLDSYSWNIHHNTLDKCLSFYNSLSDGGVNKKLILEECNPASTNQQFKFSLSGLAYTIQVYHADEDNFLAFDEAGKYKVTTQTTEKIKKENSDEEEEVIKFNAFENWEFRFDGESYSIFNLGSKNCLVQGGDNIPEGGECIEAERYSIFPVGSQYLKLEEISNDNCSAPFGRKENCLELGLSEDFKEIVKNVTGKNEDEEEKEEKKKNAKNKSFMTTFKKIGEFLQVGAAMCYGDYTSEELGEENSKASNALCGNFPLSKTSKATYGSFLASVTGIPCSSEQVDFKVCALFNKCHTYGLIVNNGPVKCFAAVSGDAIGGIGKILAKIAGVVESVGLGYSYTKKYTKNFNVFNYDVSGGVFEKKKITVASHIWVGGALGKPDTPFDDIKIGDKKLGDLIEFEAKIDLMVDFGNAAQIIKKWIASFNTFGGENSNSEDVKPTLYDNTSKMLKELLNAKAEFAISDSGKLKFLLSKITFGYLPDLELDGEVGFLLTQGGGTSGMPAGLYFYIESSSILNVIGKLLVDFFGSFLKYLGIDLSSILGESASNKFGLTIKSDSIGIHFSSTIVTFSCAYRFATNNISCDFGGSKLVDTAKKILTGAIELVNGAYDFVVYQSKNLFDKLTKVTESVQKFIVEGVSNLWGNIKRIVWRKNKLLKIRRHYYRMMRKSRRNRRKLF